MTTCVPGAQRDPTVRAVWMWHCGRLGWSPTLLDPPLFPAARCRVVSGPYIVPESVPVQATPRAAATASVPRPAPRWMCVCPPKHGYACMK